MIITLDEYEDIKKVSTGFPNLDYAMGGGFIEGSSNTIVGEAKSGKSSFCVHFAALAQKRGKKTLYVSIEARPHLQYMESLGVVKNKDFSILIPEGAAEEMLDEIQKKILLEDYYILIIDSVAAMTPQDALSRSFQEGDRVASLAKLATSMLQRFTPIANKKRMIILLINQLRENIGYHGKHMPGGAAIEFYSSHVLYMKEDRAKGNKDFKYINVAVKKSRLNTEGAEVALYKSRTGPYSRWLSAVDYISTRDLLKRGGSYYSIKIEEEEYRAHGQLGFVSLLKEKYGDVDTFMNEVKKQYPEEEVVNEIVELEKETKTENIPRRRSNKAKQGV